MIAGDDQGIGLFVMMVDDDASFDGSISNDSDLIPSLIDHGQFSDNKSNDESVPALVPCMDDNEDSNNNTGDDDSAMPALVDQVEDSDKDSDNNSWGSYLENNLDNSNVPYSNIVRNYDYKLDNKSAEAEEPRVVEYTMSGLA